MNRNNKSIDIKRPVDSQSDGHSVSIRPFRTWEIVAATLATIAVGAGLLYWYPGGGGQQAAVDIKINTPATYDEPLEIKSDNNQTFSIAPLGAQPARATTVGNVTTYVDAFLNTDVTQTKEADKMKEDVIFKKPGHPASLSYQIDVAPYEFGKNADGDWMFYQKGHAGDETFWAFTISAPFMIDASGKKSSVKDVDSELSDTGLLVVTPSAAWLANAKYPVDLDPTIIFRGGVRGVNAFSATGGTITYTDSNGENPRSSPAYAGGYTVHTFTANGDFTVTGSGNVDYLIVAGGGGAGDSGEGPGGGGAGGYKYMTSQAVTAQAYPIVIGTGGPAHTQGNNSTAFGNTIIGGGYGGAGSQVGGTGGSGGGGGSNGTDNSGGSGTDGQGYAGGGASTDDVDYWGGGGGGAGGVGQPGRTGTGDGGLAVSNSISGSAVDYAGGGRAGGARVGSNGAGTIGRGGDGQSAGAGNDGVVIIRYKAIDAISAVSGSPIVFRSTAKCTTSGSGVLATGGTITYTDSNGANPRSSPAYADGYTVHTFATSGNFTVTSGSGNVNVLVVAGGGGGGGGRETGGNGGGGGGGGVRSIASVAVTTGSSPYTITIGDGGSAGVSSGGNAGKGNNSSALGYSATGGGLGSGSKYPTGGINGGNGGSGGGTGAYSGTGNGTGNEGGYTPAEGYDGKNQGSGDVGGGGGGATAAATSATGGTGLTSSISGSSVVYGTGGDSGGGATGTANRGIGGQGGDYGGEGSGPGGAGGSGVVIIKYLTTSTSCTTGLPIIFRKPPP